MNKRRERPERAVPLVSAKLSESARIRKAAMDFADSFHAAMRRCALHPDHPVPDHAQDDAEDAIAFMRKAQLIRESESDNSNGTSTAEETSDTQEQPQ